MEDNKILMPSLSIDTFLLENSSTDDFLQLPNNAATNFTQQALGAYVEGFEAFASRKEEISKGSSVEFKLIDNKPMIRYKTKNNDIVVALPDISKLNVATQNLFPLLLMIACKKCVKDGVLYSEEFSFKTSDLVDLKMYKDIRSARVAVEAARLNLSQIVIAQKKLYIEGEEKPILSGGLFSLDGPYHGKYIVYLNNKLNWGIITEFWTILPSYYFTLKRKAKDLTSYIFISARQAANKQENFNINENGQRVLSYNIPFKTLQAVLHLPDIYKKDTKGNLVLTKRGYREIKQPIEEAVAEVEEAHRKTYHNNSLQLFLRVDDRLKPDEYLNEGSLNVKMLNPLLETYEHIIDNKTSIIQKNIKAKQKREAKASEN